MQDPGGNRNTKHTEATGQQTPQEVAPVFQCAPLRCDLRLVARLPLLVALGAFALVVHHRVWHALRIAAYFAAVRGSLRRSRHRALSRKGRAGRGYLWFVANTKYHLADAPDPHARLQWKGIQVARHKYAIERGQRAVQRPRQQHRDPGKDEDDVRAVEVGVDMPACREEEHQAE